MSENFDQLLLNASKEHNYYTSQDFWSTVKYFTTLATALLAGIVAWLRSFDFSPLNIVILFVITIFTSSISLIAIGAIKKIRKYHLEGIFKKEYYERKFNVDPPGITWNYTEGIDDKIQPLLDLENPTRKEFIRDYKKQVQYFVNDNLIPRFSITFYVIAIHRLFILIYISLISFLIIRAV